MGGLFRPLWIPEETDISKPGAVMIDQKKIAACQDKIARHIMAGYDVPWDFAIVDIEISDRVTDELMFLFKNNGQEFERMGVVTPDNTSKMFRELRELMCDGQEDRTWNVCTLEIDATSGKYRFSFSYDPPVRLSGIALDDRTMNYRPKPW